MSIMRNKERNFVKLRPQEIKTQRKMKAKRKVQILH